MHYIRPAKKAFVPNEQMLMTPIAYKPLYGDQATAIVHYPAKYPLEYTTVANGQDMSNTLQRRIPQSRRNLYRILVWTHSLAHTLDHIGMRQMVDEHGWQIDFIIDMDPPGICVLSKGRLKVAFWDLRNWLNMTIGELIDKMPEEEQIAAYNYEREQLATEAEYRSMFVCCYAIRKIQTMCQANKWGPMRATCAAQSMAVYANKYPLTNGPLGWKGQREWPPTWSGDTKVYPITHGDKELLDAERTALYGGVVSCFRPNEVHDDVEVWDCNGLYGHLGAERLFPVKYLGPFRDNGQAESLANDGSVTGFANVRIKSDAYPFPCRSGDRNRYVRGSYCTCLTFAELKVGFREKVVVEVLSGTVYAAERLFGLFSDKLLDMKKAYTDLEDKLSVSIVKRVLNGLWGKFGQRNDIWRRLPDVEPMRPWSMWAGLDADTRQVVLYRALGMDVWERSGTYYPPHASPIISAVMCAHARVYMTDIIRLLDPATVLYSATDSLHLTPAGSHKLKSLKLADDTEPGKFSRRESLSTVKYARPGWYTSDSKTVRAGVPLDGRMNERGNIEFVRLDGLRALISTPTLTHLRSHDVELTPPVASRRKRTVPKDFAELWERYTQRRRSDDRSLT